MQKRKYQTNITGTGTYKGRFNENKLNYSRLLQWRRHCWIILCYNSARDELQNEEFECTQEVCLLRKTMTGMRFASVLRLDFLFLCLSVWKWEQRTTVDTLIHLIFVQCMCISIFVLKKDYLEKYVSKTYIIPSCSAPKATKQYFSELILLPVDPFLILIWTH